MKKLDKKTILQTVQGYAMMVLGCISYALGVAFFLKPCGIVAGGIAGLATLFHLLNENVPIGLVTIVLNIPIFLLGLKYTGKTFILKALLTVGVLGLFTDLFAVLPPLTTDPVLAALYGGICQGLGIGLFVRYEFSSGGTELLGRVISRWIKILNIPVCVGICDAVIVLSGAIALANASNILYALIVIFVSTKLSEMVLVGLEKSKLCIIISAKGEEISQTLIKESPRGVTLLDGQGMYTKERKDVLLTCVKNRQLTQLRAIVRSVDENAFVIINDSVEVRGKGFSRWDE